MARGLVTVSIDDELIDAVLQPDQFHRIRKDAPIRGIIHLKIVDYKTEENIGENRTADILLTVIKDSTEERLVVEVENDRKFDAGEILRKIKKDNRYPAIVIIPKKFEKYGYRFLNSGINVAYWTATCKFRCEHCEKINESDSSILSQEFKCGECKKGSNLQTFIGIKNAEFKPDSSNAPFIFRKPVFLLR